MMEFAHTLLTMAWGICCWEAGKRISEYFEARARIHRRLNQG